MGRGGKEEEKYRGRMQRKCKGRKEWAEEMK